MHIQSQSIPPPESGPCLLVHGGAWDIPDEACKDHRDGMQKALSRGKNLLQAGASALEAACETVMVMEHHGAFDAGCGAVLTRDGTVELDAGLMDGATLRFGAVAGVQRIAHPIQLAHTVLTQGKGQVRLMAGVGAERFAEQHGFDLIANHDLIHPREHARFKALEQASRYHTSHSFLEANAQPRGTVGCVARDVNGHLAAATSTGGTPFRPAGRIGDSPLPGSGFYATAHGAASATGWGEAIATVLLCGRAVLNIAQASRPQTIVEEGLRFMATHVQNDEGVGGTGGLIYLNAAGAGAWAFTTPRMARGGWRQGQDAWVLI